MDFIKESSGVIYIRQDIIINGCESVSLSCNAFVADRKLFFMKCCIKEAKRYVVA